MGWVGSGLAKWTNGQLCRLLQFDNVASCQLGSEMRFLRYASQQNEIQTGCDEINIALFIANEDAVNEKWALAK